MTKIKISWISSARSDVEKIKRYYKDVAGIDVAKRIALNIKIQVDILKTHPEIGQEEETLKSLNEGHRYLVSGNYKIIYKVLNKTVFITTVFDTRQNPNKLVKRNK